MKWKIVDGFLALMFFVFGLVQYNDPDPGLWMLVYGAMCGVCIAATFNRFSLGLMIPMAGGYLILSALHVDGMLEWLKSPNRKMLFDDVAKMQYPYIEEAREFLGLLICVVVLLYLFYRQRAYARSVRAASAGSSP
jgi:hypothetical protein